jgi:hypothetical protein
MPLSNPPPVARVCSAATSAVTLMLCAFVNALRAGFNGVEATPSVNV